MMCGDTIYFSSELVGKMVKYILKVGQQTNENWLSGGNRSHIRSKICGLCHRSDSDLLGSVIAVFVNISRPRYPGFVATQKSNKSIRLSEDVLSLPA